MITGNYRKAIAVDVSSTDHVFAAPCKALYVGGAGDIVCKLTDAAATSVTFKAVPVGTILPVEIKTVVKTSTTATLMLGLFR